MTTMQYYDREQGKYVTVTPETPLPVIGELGANERVAALTPIADPSAATVEDVAQAYNDLLTALKG